MFEKMTEVLPDVNAYLHRIGLNEAEAPSLSFLNRVIHAHQTHIPFENLDIRRDKRIVSLEISKLYDKIVTRKRGGFCFEQNLLLAQALRDLGFDAYTVFCRIFWFLEDKTTVPPCLHCAVIVTLDGLQYFCDVGFGGPQPSAAVPVVFDEETVLPEESWKMERAGERWISFFRKGSDEEWKLVLQFNLTPQTPQEFIPPSVYCCVSETSLFTRSLVVGIKTENGSKGILDDVFTVHEDGRTIRRTLETEEETDRILKEEFGIG